MTGSWFHPNGVLPEGNLFLGTTSNEKSAVRSEGLGQWRYLPDTLVAEILALCDARTLSRCGRLSKVFYVFSQLDYLWRDLVLMHTQGRGISFHCTWKHTYSHILMRPWVSSCSCVPKAPIKLKGLYSQFLFHSWLCGHYDLESVAPGLLRHEDIPRVSAQEMTVERFIEEYEKPNRPVIITDALTEQWKALSMWNEDYLASEGGNEIFRATSGVAVMPAYFTMKEYLQYASQVNEESPLYLFDKKFGKIGRLGEDYIMPDYFNPKILAREGLTEKQGFETDLFRLLGDEKRPDHKWLVIGPQKSGSIFHVDPNQTNAWNVSIKGRKKWIFYPPCVNPPGVQPSADGGDVIVPVSVAEWLINFWSFHQEARCHKDASKRPMEAVLGPGEIMFVPHNYWHMVINLDFSIALTQNYVSTSNLFSCLKFLKFKPTQISGVRGYEEGSISADNLFSIFSQRLNEHFPPDHPIYSQCMQRLEKLSTNSESSHCWFSKKGKEEKSRKRKACALGSSDRSPDNCSDENELDSPVSKSPSQDESSSSLRGQDSRFHFDFNFES